LGAHDKASSLLGKGELICEAREILHFYQYQTDADVATDDVEDATISASGDIVFTDSAEGTGVVDQSNSFITADMTSTYSFYSGDGGQSASVNVGVGESLSGAIAKVCSADEVLMMMHRLIALLRFLH